MPTSSQNTNNWTTFLAVTSPNIDAVNNDMKMK